MWRHVALVRTGISKELLVSNIEVKKPAAKEIVTANFVSS
jgi:hypothetical protein